MVSSVCKTVIFSLVYITLAKYASAQAVDCSNESKHHYAAYPYDCSKYMGCKDGSYIVFDCPTGEYWNQTNLSCDLQKEADCSNVIPFPVPDCSDGSHKYFPYPYDCSKFWECLNYKEYLLPCADGLLFSYNDLRCEEAGTVDCSYVIPTSGSTTGTPTASTVTRTAATSEVPYSPPDMDCAGGQQYAPDPYNCHFYYECSNGAPIRMPCGDLIWDVTINNCLPIGQGQCATSTQWVTGSTAKTPSGATTDVPYPSPAMDCAGKQQYAADPYDCHRFYKCDNGRVEHMICGANLVWDVDNETCNYDDSVHCQVSTKWVNRATPAYKNKN